MQLPFENVVSAFEKMVPVSMDAGSEVIRQGEPGDLFYLLEEGEAEVWKSGPYDDEQQFVCKLGPGDQFGEEALVSGGTRNATIRLTRDSKLLTLAKDDFDDLIKAHLVEEVDIAVAKAMMESGRVMLDVRYEEEWEDAHIPDVKLLPLHELRDRLDELDRGARYITYCLSGKRSAVAAMIMKQHGFDTVCMRNGLRDWPYETVAEY